MSFLDLLMAIHVLGAVAWVGGMFFAIAVLRPSLQVLEPQERLKLHVQVFRRFFRVVWHVMPLIILSGFIMLFGYYGGPANAAWNVHVMLLTGLVMAALFVAIVFGPYRTLRAATDRLEMANAVNGIRRLVTINLVLGVVTVIVAVLG